MQGGAVPTNGCGSPPRCRAHELADLEDKTATATVNVRGWSGAGNIVSMVMSFELDI